MLLLRNERPLFLAGARFAQGPGFAQPVWQPDPRRDGALQEDSHHGLAEAKVRLGLGRGAADGGSRMTGMS